MQQGRMKPPAVLVRPLEEQISRHRQPEPLQSEYVGRAGVKPDIGNIGYLCVVGGVIVVPQKFGGVAVEPAVGAMGGEGFGNSIEHGLVAKWLSRCAVHKDRQRHPPRALS